MYCRRQLLFFLLIVCSVIGANSQVIYVKANASGKGTSWSDATGNLKAVLDTARAGAQIWVTQGVYVPGNCSACTLQERDVYFQLRNGIQLYGGFTGNETRLEDRNPVAHPTILSGDLNGDGQLLNNAFTVLYSKNVSEATVIDGVIISGGNADLKEGALGSRFTSGGGWLNESSPQDGRSNPIARNCIFRNNYALGYGGALFDEGSFRGEVSPQLYNCTFENNEAGNSGGALYIDAGFDGRMNAIFDHCTWINNRAGNNGGAIFVLGAEGGHAFPVFNANIFRNNQAVINGGAIEIFGKSGEAQPKFQDCLFENNQAEYGGGIYCDGTFNGNCSPSLDNCTFTGHHAGRDGGAIYINASLNGNAQYALAACTLTANTAGGEGGAVFCSSSDGGKAGGSVQHTVFNNNAASGNGGAWMVFSKTGEGNPSFFNCRFESNEGAAGGALYSDATFKGKCDPSFISCLFITNRSKGDGGALNISAFEGGISHPYYNHCSFLRNESDFAGAGIFHNGVSAICSGEVINCRFDKNIAHTYGGAMYNLGKAGECSQKITNCIFSSNRGSSAGGIYNLGADQGHADPVITNCTFYDNRANVGGAIYSNANDSLGNSKPIVTNCIFYRNRAPFGANFRTIFGTPLISYSLVDTSGCEVLNSGTGRVDCGPGMLYNLDPMFVDTSTGDFRLKLASPAIDAGSNAASLATQVGVDLDSLTRIFNQKVDMGAFEFHSVDNYVAPTISKQPAAADKCAGQDLQLEVTATGTPPLHYRWYQNNTPLADTDSSSLRLNNLQTGQSGNYFCRVYSSRGDSVNSNTVNVLVRATVTPAVSITSDTLRYCPGAPALFKADIVNGGSNPTLQWLINGIASGGTGLSFSTDQLHNDDQVQAVLRSNATCASPESASSNILTVQVVFCTINNIADVQPGFRFSVFPNPARSHFTLKLPEMSGSVYQLRILNAFGQLIQTENIKGSQVEIMLRPASKGMLFLQLSDANGRTATAKLMVE